MPGLFEPAHIGTLELRNRFVRSATWEGMATEDGASTPRLNALMKTLARNELGLVITGHAYVSPEGQAGSWQLGIHDDAMLPGLMAMAEAVHEAGGKVCCQLAHAGLRGNADLSGLEPVGPSRRDSDGEDRGCRRLAVSEIAGIVTAFGAAAARAKHAGFDAVQLHAAHGFLISQFLSPHFNCRDDEYGGSLENRSRLLMEVYTAVREAVGPDFPVLIKINANDYLTGKKAAFQDEDMLTVCQRLAEAGLDAVELSGGTGDSGKYRPTRIGTIREAREGYYRIPAKWFKERIDIPLILVGGIRTLSKAEGFYADGICDFISFSRPLIREPGLIKRWKDGDTAKSECMSENLCFKPILAGEGLYCKLRKLQSDRKAGE